MHPELPATRPADPAARYVYPTEVVPAAEQQLAPAPPPGMRVIGYVRIDGMLHPQYGPLHEPAIPTPPPATSGLDPQAQRTAAKGVLAAGSGVGAYFAMRAAEILVESFLQLVVALAVCGGVWALSGGRRSGPSTTYVTHNRGFLAGFRSQNGPRR